jgi:hypothetical protein
MWDNSKWVRRRDREFNHGIMDSNIMELGIIIQ